MKKIYLTLVALVAAIMPSMAQTELWDAASQSLDSYFLAPGWAPDANSSASYDPATGVATVHIAGAPAAQWQAQVKLTTTGITYNPDKYYVFSCTFNSNNAFNKATVKLDDKAGVVYDAAVEIAAGETKYVSKASKGATGGNNILVFDFGFAKANTDLTISNISIKEYDEKPADDQPVVYADPLNYDDPNNLWKSVDNGETFISVTPWFANNNWGQIADPEWSHNGSEWTLTLPEGMGSLRWQGQFPINTTLDAAMADKFDFCCIIESDNDLEGVTIKLVETDEGENNKHDANFMVEGQYDLKNGKYVHVEKGVSLSQNDAHALSLFFDFGGSPVGSKVKISNIVLINEADVAGITNVNAEASNNAIYNLAGQRVNANQNGIVVKNGKKYLNK